MLRLLPKDYRNLRDSLENRFSRVGWAATMLQKAKPFSMRRVYQPSNTRTKPRAVFVTCGGIATICAPFTRPRVLAADGFDIDLGRIRNETMIHVAQKANRTLLTESESKEILEAYGIPTVKTLIATSAKEAVQAAANL